MEKGKETWSFARITGRVCGKGMWSRWKDGKRENDFVLIIERRIWRKGGRIEKAKRNLSRLVERGYLKKHMVEVEGRKGISAKGVRAFHIFVIVR